ncbi:velvet factor-domain-containing protein [Sordaria brevicollis]|uniref:Velvet factor-domain-containing protein n=1 Tax=Sordaria brevicollis TaxID=83679 RepID=A0AAE0U9L5_SORBR|nr:velvet factor-domain-containing protein [Sordaria brevicollis]
MQPYSNLPPDHGYHHASASYPPRQQHHQQQMQQQQQQQLPSMAPPSAPLHPPHTTNPYQDPSMTASMSGPGSGGPSALATGPGGVPLNNHGDVHGVGGQLPPSQQQQSGGQHGQPGQQGQGQDGRAPLTAEERMQQEQNLKPYSGTDSQGRMYSEIEYSMFICNVSLYTEDALKEVNLVRHTTSTPSISSTTPASYASLEQTTPAYSHILPSNRGDMGGYGGHPHGGGMPGYQGGMNPYEMGGGPYQAGFVNGNPYSAPAPSHYQYNAPGLPHTGPYGAPPRGPYDPHPGAASGYGGMPGVGGPLQQRMSISGGGAGGQQPQGMFTRNLIGSLVCSAFRLTDTNDKIGIWFVMQDLSVRTEGVFRLQFSFVNVGLPTPMPGPSSSSSSSGGSTTAINQSKAPILASVFSEPFQVFSAKKFPGVCDSTALSKCFATQGIKIPIRKEGANNKGGEEDDDY